MVRGRRRVPPRLPSPGQQLAAHPVELTDVAPPEAAQDLGLPELVRQRLDLGDAPGRANTSDKMMTLVASALAGCDCIDDADVLRTGGRPAPWAARSRRHPPWAPSVNLGWPCWRRIASVEPNPAAPLRPDVWPCARVSERTGMSMRAHRV